MTGCAIQKNGGVNTTSETALRGSWKIPERCKTRVVGCHIYYCFCFSWVLQLMGEGGWGSGKQVVLWEMYKWRMNFSFTIRMGLITGGKGAYKRAVHGS